MTNIAKGMEPEPKYGVLTSVPLSSKHVGVEGISIHKIIMGKPSEEGFAR